LEKHVLEIDSVQKSYNFKLVLIDVYLKCETNDVIGVLGRNGSGKSTLLKIIYGIIDADFKHVLVDGILKNKNSQLIKEISYLDQDDFIPGHFTVKKAITLSIDKKDSVEFLNDDFIKTILNKKISQLSGGELKYLEVKLVLSNDSNFVLLDEPYKGLSPILIDKINQLIIENSKNKGIIITDHKYLNVIKVSNRLVLMKSGAIYNLKDKSELINHGYLNEGVII
jgi:ABC-type multidrug transport system ATPase subunit